MKAEIKKRLKQGKEAIDRIERELEESGKSKPRIENKLRDAREKKLRKAKVEFNKRKAQATSTTQKENPEKALSRRGGGGGFRRGTLDIVEAQEIGGG